MTIIIKTQCCCVNNNAGILLFPRLLTGAPTLNDLTSSVNDTHVVIMWSFNDNGVPVSSFNVTIDCGGQPIVENVPPPMTGNEVTSTRTLTSYPADTSCTVTVATSNVLGSSNTLTNTFTTPTDTFMTPTEGECSNRGCVEVQFETTRDEYCDAMGVQQRSVDQKQMWTSMQ